ncbi:MAG: flagellar motor protein MotB [Alphaproteobacteria bacterium]
MHGTDPGAMPATGQSRAPSLFGGVWLISFADLVSLLVSFFIMLYSMSDVPPAGWDALRGGLAQGLGQDSAPAVLPEDPARTPLGESAGANLDYLAVLLRDRIAAEFGDSALMVARRDDRVVVTLADPALFVPHQMAVSDESAERLGRLASLLSHVRNRIEVLAIPAEPDRGVDERSWALAIGRAQAVAQALERSSHARGIVALATNGGPTHGLAATSSATGSERIEIHMLGVKP